MNGNGPVYCVYYRADGEVGTGVQGGWGGQVMGENGNKVAGSEMAGELHGKGREQTKIKSRLTFRSENTAPSKQLYFSCLSSYPVVFGNQWCS